MKERITLPGEENELPYSEAVRSGHTLYVSGQVGFAEDGTVPETIEEQTTLAIKNAEKVLAAAGATLDDVVMCQCFLQKKEDFAGMNAAYSQCFGGEGKIYPARYTVLAPPVEEIFLVEIAMIAEVE